MLHFYQLVWYCFLNNLEWVGGWVEKNPRRTPLTARPDVVNSKVEGPRTLAAGWYAKFPHEVKPQ